MNTPTLKRIPQGISLCLCLLLAVLHSNKLALATPVSDVQFAETAFKTLAKGRAIAATYIDWKHFIAMGIDVGKSYRTMRGTKARRDYRNSFVTSFSKSFIKAGGDAEVLKNWRVKTRTKTKTVVDAQAPNHAHLLLTITRVAGRQKFSVLALDDTPHPSAPKATPKAARKTSPTPPVKTPTKVPEKTLTKTLLETPTKTSGIPYHLHLFPKAESTLQGALAVTTENPAIPAGQPVKINITVTNTTSQRLMVVNSETNWDYEFIVQKSTPDAGGKPVLTPATLTEYGALVFSNGRIYTHFSMHELEPGEAVQANTLISRLFDMSLQGTYLVTVNCYASHPTDKGWKNVKLECPPLEVEVQ